MDKMLSRRIGDFAHKTFRLGSSRLDHVFITLNMPAYAASQRHRNMRQWGTRYVRNHVISSSVFQLQWNPVLVQWWPNVEDV